MSSTGDSASRISSDSNESSTPRQTAGGDSTLEALFQRINSMTGGSGDAKPSAADSRQASTSGQAKRGVERPGRSTRATATFATRTRDGEFVPIEPTSFRDARLTISEVEALVLKYLLAIGDASGRETADHIKLPFLLIDELLRQLKNDQLVIHKTSAAMNDYQYALTDLGMERARRHSRHCVYHGAAPVALRDYIKSIEAQSLAMQNPSLDDLNRAFEGLLLNRRIMDRLGPAVNSGRGLFLFGAPGNGKTSIAERVTRAFGEYVWIPRAIGVAGEIIQLFDPINHDEAPLDTSAGLLDSRHVDRRWVRIRRPTIIAGGELTMSQLEVTVNSSTGVSEAPLQMKSNCGTLVIDDFGRQKMPVDHLLNRWIVPLEKRYDFLNLPNGMKIRVPFDQLIVFSTNLEPRDLVDEAFLRRIPYKIEVTDPSETEFCDLMKIMAGSLDFEYNEHAVEYLLEKHYRTKNRPLRYCHPRDLLLQIVNYCAYQNSKREMTEHYFDLACENYFAVM